MTVPNAISTAATIGSQRPVRMASDRTSEPKDMDVLGLLARWSAERDRQYAMMTESLTMANRHARELVEFLGGGPEPGNAEPAAEVGSPNATHAPATVIPCGPVKPNVSCGAGQLKEVLSCRLRSATMWWSRLFAK